MGDVALAVPVIEAAISQNRAVEFYVLTAKPFEIFFKGLNGVKIIAIDLKGKEGQAVGLLKLAHKITKTVDLAGIIDLHAVLRSHLMGLLFRLKGLKVAQIDKERKFKRLIIKGKIARPLKHTTRRYTEVFEKFGLKADCHEFKPQKIFIANSNSLQTLKFDHSRIGFAPFAAYKIKAYPLELSRILIKQLLQFENYQIFIFGGGLKDEILLSQLLNFEYNDRIIDRVKPNPLEDQLAMIEKMNVMVTMDSANMHLAQLVGTKVISLWGPTHSYFGFGPLGKGNIERILEVDAEYLACRPCSSFGQKSCIHPEQYCFTRLAPNLILKTIQKTLEN